MERLQLTREINISRVEQYLDSLSEEPARDIATHEQIEGASFGGEAALIQLLFTWAKQHPRGRLWLKFAGSDEDLARSIDKYSNRAFGFVAMLMASEILTVDGQDCRKLAYKSCESRVDQLVASVENSSSGDQNMEAVLSSAVFGHRTFLPCVDHSSKSNISPFYHPNGSFRQRSEFRRFANVLIERRTHHFVEENAETLSGLGSILYELMHNTNDWATTEADGTTLRKSIRGILFTHLYLPKSSIQKAAGNHAELSEYMHSVESRNPNETIHLAELSVFDAGPGLAGRWLALNENNDTDVVTSEHEACVNCLGVHRTTSSDSYRGVGLFDVMQTLNRLSAMVRVRTGRIAMFRNFIANPLANSEIEAGPSLPLSKEHHGRPEGLSQVAGTTFTIMFPLK
jgi:hypothetical protein